ncbi:serine hydrolase domain-containing protein [Actinoplanes utahensis]|uniref:serine hydrolase domain-containing protein n=1 Tax=Actinoplanes utahensis TaxID=1869 RepID=UPI00068AC86F|nr:serine hydrolase domain-containing protein [Actinoplanes utahensis]GIF32628.1 serine hydrolase [Actinoplanes utahensis]
MIKLPSLVMSVLVAATPAPAGSAFANDVLRPGTARQAGLLPDRIAALPVIAAAYLEPTLDHPGHPVYAGATVLAAHRGLVVSRFAVGDAVRYTAGPDGIVELPTDQRVPARTDTLWDLASISKLFTAILVLQQAEAGRLDLDAPVARYVPELAAAHVTARQLLTHTSGLPAWLPLHLRYPTAAQRLAAALATPAGPAGAHVYSDIGLIVLGVLVERVTGKPLGQAVRAGVTGPLGMRSTGYNPGPALRERAAATEHQPAVGRGMVRGEVHDENAWALGGVAGHAGLFSTADDLAILCQALLNGGTHRGRRILSEESVRQALTDHGDGRGLGFQLGEHTYMDGMASPITFGHTGFTGTSVVIDPIDRSFLIVLSNRVHPDRTWARIDVARRALARTLAQAHPIPGPAATGTPWRADRRDGAVMTLTAGPAHGSFQIWYDTEPRNDTVTVESSADGITWAPLPMTLRSGADVATSDGTLTGFGGRRWWRVHTDASRLRFTYRTDAASQGRGVLVAGIRQPYTADGWTSSQAGAER